MKTTTGFFLLPALALCLCTTAHAGWLSSPENYEECVLEDLEGAQNDVAAINAANGCRKRFPDYNALPEKKSPLLFGPATLRECVQAYAKTTPSHFAANQIYRACFALYPDDGKPL